MSDQAVFTALEAFEAVIAEAGGRYNPHMKAMRSAITAVRPSIEADGAAAERRLFSDRIDALLARHDGLPVWLRCEIAELGGEGRC